jgi:adenine-specific DNA-methyltransferase
VPEKPDSEEGDSFTFTKEPNIIEHKAYRDTWGHGLDSYLQWFYETAVLLHDMLHESGSIYGSGRRTLRYRIHPAIKGKRKGGDA